MVQLRPLALHLQSAATLHYICTPQQLLLDNLHLYNISTTCKKTGLHIPLLLGRKSAGFDFEVLL
mgnify:CR=1 FL=1